MGFHQEDYFGQTFLRWLVKMMLLGMVFVFLLGFVLGNGDVLYLLREAGNLWAQKDDLLARVQELKSRGSQLDAIRSQFSVIDGAVRQREKAKEGTPSGVGTPVSSSELVEE